MKVALVHDYLNEYGGAERVLKTLTQMYPQAPIYTAFVVRNSTAQKEFKDSKIIQSWLAPILKIGKLYSPLRFLAPALWRSFDLSKYDLVIVSASWYLTKGFKVGPNTKVVCYCHTPPRYLYGFETSIQWQKYWPVRLYALVVNHFLRMFDYKEAQKIRYWIVNSKEVQGRVERIYHKKAQVIYPPVAVEEIIAKTKNTAKENFYLIVSRLVGAKGIEAAVEASSKLGFKLKIVGESAGFSALFNNLTAKKLENVELLGRVPDEELYRLYASAKGFIALARQEDFGMTPVESMAAGTPVLAFRGGGFKESVVEGITGVFVNEVNSKSLKIALEKMEKIKWNKVEIQKQALNFSKEKFVDDFNKFIQGTT
jgi:glycosyltransferase involved in cell wall biosynthesis